MIASVMGLLGPTGAASVFAFSVDHQILGGNLLWLVFTVIALIGIGAGYLLREPERKERDQ